MTHPRKYRVEVVFERPDDAGVQQYAEAIADAAYARDLDVDVGQPEQVEPVEEDTPGPRRKRGAMSPPRSRRGRELVAMSNAMVALYKDRFGRGPLKSSARYAGEDILVCTLRDSLTRAETTMLELQEFDRLRDLRMFLQYANQDAFIATVERLTGRKVRAFVSGIDVEQDYSTEVFYLVPEEEGAEE